MKELAYAIIIGILGFGLGYFVSLYFLFQNAELQCETVLESCEKDQGVEIVSTFDCTIDEQQLLYIEPIYSCPDKKVKSIILSGKYDTTTNENHLYLNLIAGKVGNQHICIDTITTGYVLDTVHLITLKLELCENPISDFIEYRLPINFKCKKLRVVSSLEGADCQTMACRGGAEYYKNNLTPKICDFNLIL